MYSFPTFEGDSLEEEEAAVVLVLVVEVVGRGRGGLGGMTSFCWFPRGAGVGVRSELLISLLATCSININAQYKCKWVRLALLLCDRMKQSLN